MSVDYVSKKALFEKFEELLRTHTLEDKFLKNVTYSDKDSKEGKIFREGVYWGISTFLILVNGEMKNEKLMPEYSPEFIQMITDEAEGLRKEYDSKFAKVKRISAKFFSKRRLGSDKYSRNKVNKKQVRK